jgi:hypothetical protein
MQRTFDELALPSPATAGARKYNRLLQENPPEAVKPDCSVSTPARTSGCLSDARSYASFKACAMSAIRSDGCSMPIDSRIVESRTPIF